MCSTGPTARKLLRELVPTAARIAGLFNLSNPALPPQWLGRQRRGRPPRQDHVDVQADQLRRQGRESLVATIDRSVLDDVCFALDVPEVPHPLSKPVDIRRVHRDRRPLERADAIGLLGRLRASGKRGEEGDSGHAAQESAAVHRRRSGRIVSAVRGNRSASIDPGREASPPAS